MLNQGPDRDVNLVMIKAYNDWHVDEWCGAYPERFIPCGVLPLFDVDEAAKEVHRLADKGCHAVTFSENPAGLGMPSIHTTHWHPLSPCAARPHGAVLRRRTAVEVVSINTLTRRRRGQMNLSSSMSIHTLGDPAGEVRHRSPRRSANRG